MGKTLVEKVVAKAAGQEVTAGEFVNVRADALVMCEFYWPHIKEVMEELEVETPWDPDRIAIVIDHTTSLAMSPPETPVHRSLRAYTTEHQIPGFYPVGRGGLRHQVAVEHGHIPPGGLVISDEPNMASFGALGAINYPIGWDIAAVFLLGETWMRVPETWRVEVSGTFRTATDSRDLALKLLSDLGDGGALWKCLEFAGPAIDAMSIDARMNLLALAYLCSAETAVINPDDKAAAFLLEHPPRFPYDLAVSDADADYERVISYDVADLQPQISGPNSPTASRDLADVIGLHVDQAAIGSCSNGRIEDLRAVASVLRGNVVHPDVRFFVTPISQQVYMEAMQEGLVATIAQAGAVVLPPGCNTCYGYLGVLDDGEVCIATHSAAYPGRMGSTEAEIYLANPAVVAAAAVAGQVVHPVDVIGGP